MSKAPCIVPRSFVLLDELEKSEKGQYSPYCSIGMKDMTDVNLKGWNGIIMTHPDSAVGEQFISVDIDCGMKYPDVPPVFRLTCGTEVLTLRSDSSKSHILKKYIGSGSTITNTLPILQKWNRDMRMITIMDFLKKTIETNRLPSC